MGAHPRDYVVTFQCTKFGAMFRVRAHHISKASLIRRDSLNRHDQLVSYVAVVAIRWNDNNNERNTRFQISNAESDTRNLGAVVTARPFPSASIATKHAITT
jgi:hypothetical protein